MDQTGPSAAGGAGGTGVSWGRGKNAKLGVQRWSKKSEGPVPAIPYHGPPTQSDTPVGVDWVASVGTPLPPPPLLPVL